MARIVAGRLFVAGQLCLCAACVPAQTPRSVDSHALSGITLAVPEPADARDTPGIGCGIIVQDLSLRAYRVAVVEFSNAGATVTNEERAPWVLKLAIREATMGAENVPPRRTDPPVRQGQPDMPPIGSPQASLINGGNDNADFTFDATLAHEGRVVWRDTVSGHAKSAPCVQAYDKVREAMREALDTVREQVIRLVHRP